MHIAHDETRALIGRVSKDPVYGELELCRFAGVQSYVAAPVEFGDCTRVASVCALSTDSDRYGESDLALLTVAARLIAYEWEYVAGEGKLRRLARQQPVPIGDALTGLPLRDAFLEQLEREWHLTRRGMTESYVAAIKPLGIDAARATSGDAVGDLLLQSTSEVILAEVRRTDIAGRVADDVFGVILVGCMRLNGAFERKLSHRPERLELAFGVERLSDTELAAAALERAEDALGVGPAAHGARGP